MLSQLRWLCLLISLWVLIACNKQTKQNSAIINPPNNFWSMVDTTCPIAYIALDMEKAAGLPVTKAEYDIIDSILKQCSQNIVKQNSYTRQQAINILQSINNVLYKYQKLQHEYHPALSMCLKYGIFDCDINALLYITVAQHLKLPIKAVIMPVHAAVTWQLNNDTIYWETIGAIEKSKQYYQQHYNIKQKAIQNNGFLQALSQNQLYALIFYNIGKTYTDLGYYKTAVPYLFTASNYWQNWSKPPQALGYIYLKQNNLDSAVIYTKNALYLNDNSPFTYKTLFMAYNLLGCISDADSIKACCIN